jgi:two-component system NtrC family sensor kinase
VQVRTLPSEPKIAGREPVAFAARERHYGLGLRAQTLLALTAAFLVAFSGLSIVIVQVAQKSHEVERQRRAATLAEALVSALPPLRDDAGAATERALSALIGHAHVIGARVGTQPPRDIGDTSGAAAASAVGRDGTRLTLWTRREPESGSPLGRLLRLYAFLTGTLILIVVYVTLTRLIVRPVEKLTAAVARFSRGAVLDEAPIEIAGAAEVAQLGVTFNSMARDLKLDKQQLEARLSELEQTTRELRATQDQLIRSEKLASVGRLAAGVAHEIGNPLAAILGLLELIQLGSSSRAEESEFLARIRSETERIHRIIRDLLDYARSEPGREPDDQPAHADLEQVVAEAVALIAPQKDLRKMTLERRVHGSDMHVRGSAHELTQIVLNLLLNAADAVGGTGSVIIELARDGRTVELAITDSGHGIPSEVQDKLFDPFVTTKPAGKGTGLGLAVCLAIVERLGGSIRGENLAHGARFTVRLPALNSPS